MNKLTGKQLGAMLLISDAFALFCFRGAMSLGTLAGLCAGIILQFLLILPLIYGCGRMGNAVKIFFSLFYILWGGMLFNMQWETSREIHIPYEDSGGTAGKLLISGLIALVCMYISSSGIKAAGRASLIAAAAGGLCLLLAAVSAVRDADWENLKRAGSGRTISAEIIRGLSMSGALGGMAVLLPITKGSRLRNVTGYLSAKLILTAAVVLVSVLVTGGIMEITEYPAVRAAQLSQPFPVQRIDPLFMIVFTVYAVFSVGIQAAMSGYIIGGIFPSAEKYAGAVSLVLMTGAALLLSGVSGYSGITAAAVSAAVFAVPVISCAWKAVRERCLNGYRQ